MGCGTTGSSCAGLQWSSYGSLVIGIVRRFEWGSGVLDVNCLIKVMSDGLKVDLSAVGGCRT